MLKFSSISIFLLLLFLVPGTDLDAQTGSSSEGIQSQNPLEITEWKVPWDGRPRDPFVAPDGNIFFVGQQTHYVGHFDLQTEEFSRFDLEDGAGPHNVIVDTEGTPWYAGNRANHIGKLNPEDGEIQKFMMPDDNSARDPHTMVFDKNGDIWFTSQGANSVGKLDPETGEPVIIPVPTARARPYGIVMDTDMERPWIVLFGSNKLATVDPETMELTEIELPREDARPRRLAITSDGNIWYNDYAEGYIGVYNPEDESFREWEMPDGNDSRPYAMAKDSEDRLWVVASGLNPNKFIGFDPATESFVSQEIESGGGTVRHMVFDEETNAIWFGTDTNYLGRAVLAD